MRLCLIPFYSWDRVPPCIQDWSGAHYEQRLAPILWRSPCLSSLSTAGIPSISHCTRLLPCSGDRTGRIWRWIGSSKWEMSRIFLDFWFGIRWVPLSGVGSLLAVWPSVWFWPPVMMYPVETWAGESSRGVDPAGSTSAEFTEGSSVGRHTPMFRNPKHLDFLMKETEQGQTMR